MPILQYKYDGDWVTYTPGFINKRDEFIEDHSNFEDYLFKTRVNGRYPIGSYEGNVTWCYTLMESSKLRTHYTDEDKALVKETREIKSRQSSARSVESRPPSVDSKQSNEESKQPNSRKSSARRSRPPSGKSSAQQSRPPSGQMSEPKQQSEKIVDSEQLGSRPPSGKIPKVERSRSRPSSSKISEVEQSDSRPSSLQRSRVRQSGFPPSSQCELPQILMNNKNILSKDEIKLLKEHKKHTEPTSSTELKLPQIKV